MDSIYKPRSKCLNVNDNVSIGKITGAMPTAQLHWYWVCPQSGDQYVDLVRSSLSSFLKSLSRSSLACNLNFNARKDDLVASLDRITVEEEEEKIKRQQVEEDLRTYGSRPEPSDAVAVDENEQLTTKVLKRNASVEVGIDRPAKVRKKQDYNEKITAMDWNAGESPLSAWLNQSAIPAAMPMVMPSENRHPEMNRSNTDGLLNQEKKEIEAFKNIHIDTAAEPATVRGLSNTDHNSCLELGAQIYYRNIEDRYPSLPSFLIRRLAVANQDRAERLQHQRLKRELKEANIDAENQGVLLEDLTSSNPWSSWAGMMKNGRICGTLPRTEAFNDASTRSPYRGNFRMLGEQYLSQLSVLSTRKGTMEELQEIKPEKDFWTARRPSRRSSSVRSYSSSRNSSLHGSPMMDSSYQSPVFPTVSLEREHADAPDQSRGLFPAPIDWGLPQSLDYKRKKFSFDCEICGELVRVNRRREWQ